jgi:hypothetical protein
MPLHPSLSECHQVVARQYEIRVRGRVGKSLLSRFEGFDAEIEPAETVLRGDVSDQAALHGVLDRIQDLGLELVEVRRVGTARDRLPADGDIPR